MLLDIWEAEIQIISEFWVVGKLQYTRKYGKLNRRNKWWSSAQLSNDKVDNDIGNSYLCGGNDYAVSLSILCQISLVGAVISTVMSTAFQYFERVNS